MKRFLTLALSLVMVLGMVVPSLVPTANAAEKPLDIYPIGSNISLDGVLSDGEWGEPINSYTHSTYGDKVKFYINWDATNCYIAVWVETTANLQDGHTYLNVKSSGTPSSADFYYNTSTSQWVQSGKLMTNNTCSWVCKKVEDTQNQYVYEGNIPWVSFNMGDAAVKMMVTLQLGNKTTEARNLVAYAQGAAMSDRFVLSLKGPASSFVSYYDETGVRKGRIENIAVGNWYEPEYSLDNGATWTEINSASNGVVEIGELSADVETVKVHYCYGTDDVTDAQTFTLPECTNRSITPVSSSFALDGVLSDGEWGEPDWNISDFADVKAWWRYNEDNLYIAAEVDTEHFGNAASFLSFRYGRWEEEITLGQNSFDLYFDADGNLTAGTSTRQIAIANASRMVRTDTVTVYECQLPWTLLFGDDASFEKGDAFYGCLEYQDTVEETKTTLYSSGAKGVREAYVLAERAEVPNVSFTVTYGYTGTLAGTTAAYKYSTDGGETWNACTDGSTELTGLTAGILLVRNPGNGSSIAPSACAEISVEQAEVPTGLTAEDENAENAHDGKIKGLDAAKKYEYKTTGSNQWIDVDENSTEITNLAGGIYHVRVAASSTKLASPPSASVRVFAAGERPMSGTVTLTGNAVYDQTLTATYDGNVSEEYLIYTWKRGEEEVITGATTSTYKLVEADIGKIITVTVSAEGYLPQPDAVLTAKTDAAVVKAEGPAVGTLGTVAPAYEGATNGKITGLDANVTYEYKKTADADTAWITVTGVIEIANLPADDYQVRVKETATHFAGEIAPVTVGSGITVPIAIELDVTSKHKTEYAIGDALDVSGLRVLVRLNNGKTKVVDGTAVTVTGFDSSDIYVAQPLTVTYTENDVTKTLTYNVSIVKEILSQDEQNLMNYAWLMYFVYNQKYEISAAATEGGTITPAGITKVKYNTAPTYPAAANDGYKLKSLIVDGVDLGAISEYTFEKVKAAHTISAVFEKTAPAATYTDVKSTDWYYADVQAVTDLGLMNGTGNNAFEPKAELTRASLVTTLWRLAGEPKADVADFSDVKAGEWYTDAVNWAAANAVVNGYDGKFDPEGAITREQVIAILHRFADLMKYDSKTGAEGDYTVSDWAEADVAWANANGILTGIGTDISDMTAEATRAEIAAYLARFCSEIAK